MQSVISSPPQASLDSVLTRLVHDAVLRLSSDPETARVAARETRRALLGRMRSQGLSPAEEKRVQAYFAAVLRSQAFRCRRRGDESYRSQLRVASLISDLRSVDTPVDRIREEVQAFFGEQGLQILEAAEVA
ncbi:MAG: hypothetical protein CVT66_09325 [Actinobacteria bacterium HGW-Actinobacteria-6]|jgi:hypothetical protein|nr:MAG: hypothetical protein CVT66_09325 [Actinobacteria bacterium HGW-Actinobacteria-6]